MEVQEGFKPFLVTERSDKLDISSLSQSEMLTYAIKNGIINVSHMQQIDMSVRKNILKNHKYSIYQGSNGKWYTYVAIDEDSRKKIKRNTKLELEDAIVDYFCLQDNNPKIEQIFYEWIEKKLKRTEISKSTYERYIQVYNQCLQEIGKKRIKYFTPDKIEDMLFESIQEKELTSKGYANMRTLVLGIFKYAKKKKVTNISITDVMGDIEIPKKLFRKSKKDVEELIFNEEEMEQITEYIENNEDIINLSILLLFKTGMRIGELVSLKKEDISDGVIHVNRTEIRYRGDDGKYVYEVRDFPKTEAGVRDIILSDNGAKLLKKIKMYNPFNGEYILQKDGERIKAYTVRKRLNIICKKLNIIHKSPNKIRKTYGTILIDSGVPESIIISQMGHTNIETTKGHYYKDRNTQEQKKEVLNKIAGL